MCVCVCVCMCVCMCVCVCVVYVIRRHHVEFDSDGSVFIDRDGTHFRYVRTQCV